MSVFSVFLLPLTLVSVFSFVNFIAFSIVLFFWSVEVFAIFWAATFLHLAWVVILQQRRRDLDYKRFDQSVENQANLIELINGMQEIKLHTQKSKSDGHGSVFKPRFISDWNAIFTYRTTTTFWSWVNRRCQKHPNYFCRCKSCFGWRNDNR